MTVIIRGLDKPKECLGCQFCLKDHGRDYCIFDGEYINWEDGTVNLDCPLEKYEEPVKHGKWLKISPAGIYECSECHQNVMTGDIEAYRFCHHCGARMDG